MARRTTKTTEDDGPVEGQTNATALTEWSASSRGLTLTKEQRAMALTESADDAGSGGSGQTFLSFSGKSGRWSLGRDNEERGEDWLAILDTAQTAEGWTCWKDGKPVGKKSWSVFQRRELAVGMGALEDHGPYRDGEGWKEMMGAGFLLFGSDQSPDGAVKSLYETNAKSARNALADLLKESASRILSGKAEYPLLELGEETFEAQGKTNYKPVFTVIDWLTEEQVKEAVADPSVLYEEEPEVAPPPPTSSRRRRA